MSRRTSNAVKNQKKLVPQAPARHTSRPLSQQDRHRMSGGATTSPVVAMGARQSRSETRGTGVSRRRSPSPSRSPLRSLCVMDPPTTSRRGRGIQKSPATSVTIRRSSRRCCPPGRSTAPVGPGPHLRSAAAPKTTVASPGGRAQGRVASGRGRNRKRPGQITAAPQPKKRRTAT